MADEPVTFAGFAALTRALTSFGGPRLVAGALHLYELRPVAGLSATPSSPNAPYAIGNGHRCVPTPVWPPPLDGVCVSAGGRARRNPRRCARDS